MQSVSDLVNKTSAACVDSVNYTHRPVTRAFSRGRRYVREEANLLLFLPRLSYMYTEASRRVVTLILCTVLLVVNVYGSVEH